MLYYNVPDSGVSGSRSGFNKYDSELLLKMTKQTTNVFKVSNPTDVGVTADGSAIYPPARRGAAAAAVPAIPGQPHRQHLQIIKSDLTQFRTLRIAA